MLLALTWFSALSFLGYGIGCVYTTHMRDEFSRFGLAKFRLIVGWTQVLGAIGLLLGLAFPLAGLLASGGLALQMLLGVAVRLGIKDTLLQALPATLFLAVNAYLFTLYLPLVF